MGFPVGLRANAKAEAWGVFLTLGPWKVRTSPLPEEEERSAQVMKRQVHKAQKGRRVLEKDKRERRFRRA